MGINNDSGRDVEYEVEPTTPNITTPVLLSAALTGGGLAATALACLADFGDPELTVLGLFMLVAALVADIYVYNQASGGAASFTPTPGGRQFLSAKSRVDHEFDPGTWVVFYDAEDPKPLLAVSPPIFKAGAEVTLRDCPAPSALATLTAQSVQMEPKHVDVAPADSSSLS